MAGLKIRRALSRRGNMFSRNDRTGAGSAIPSIIGSSMKVSGDLDSEGSVQIEGTIEGDMRCAEITVGRGAHVQGQIFAELVHVHGNSDRRYSRDQGRIVFHRSGRWKHYP